MGRSKMQGTPWHYEEDLKYKIRNYNSKQRKMIEDESLMDKLPKAPIEIPKSKPGSYVYIESEDGSDQFQVMAHKDSFCDLSIGDIVQYENKKCIVTRIEMQIYKPQEKQKRNKLYS